MNAKELLKTDDLPPRNFRSRYLEEHYLENESATPE